MLRRLNSYYFRTRRGHISLALTTLGALALALFIGRTFVSPMPRQYKLDFGNAQWIETPNSAASAYFRKDLFIGSPVQQAWIQFAATGNYDMFVNDVRVAQNSIPSVRITNVVDVKLVLSQGRNTIAVYVPGGKFDGPPQILVRGSYTVVGGSPVEFVSDSSWKVSGTPDGIVNGYSWSSQELDDTAWLNARALPAGTEFSSVQRLPFDPEMIEAMPSAQWISARIPSRQTSFLYQLNLPDGSSQPWLQVAANGPYDVMVNGTRIAAQPSPVTATLIGPQTPIFLEPSTVVTKSSAPAATTPNSTEPGSIQPSATNPRTRRPSDEGYARRTDPSMQSPSTQLSVPPISLPTAGMPGLLSVSPPLQPSTPQLIPYPNSVGVQGGAPVLLAYDISGWTHAGANSIVVRVNAVSDTAMLLAAIRSDGQGETQVYGTNAEDWRTVIFDPTGNQQPPAIPLVVGSYGGPPWGPLPQVVADPQILPGSITRATHQWAATIIVVMFCVFALSISAALICQPLTGCTFEQLLSYDAILHLPMLAAAAILQLLAFDVRFPVNWCYSFEITIGLIALLLVSKLMLLFARPATADQPDLALVNRPAGMLDPAPYWFLIALGVVTVVGLILRAHNLTALSIGNDEGNMVRYSRGILRYGFPIVNNGSFTKPMTTYELTSYPLALSSLIFGHTEAAYRIPALIFGTLTVWLVGWAGYRMKDWRAGLAAAAIYACLPAPILWSRDGFYPSQEAFFGLLTFWLFFEAIRTRPINRRYMTLASIAALLAYFTWEGSGFILPTLFVALLVDRWGETDWMTDWHLWRCFLVVSAVILIQLCYRSLFTLPDFLGIIYDLSEVTTPTTVFLERLVFEPGFYVRQLLLSENQIVLTFAAAAGLLFAVNSRAVRYLTVSVIALVFFYTCFLPHYSGRYSFNGVFLLTLAASVSFFELADRIRFADFGILPRPGIFNRLQWVPALVLVLLIGANPFFLKPYRLSADSTYPPYYGRLGLPFKPDSRSSDRYVLSHAAPNEPIVTRTPQIFEFYGGKRRPDYSVDTLLTAKMFYDGGYSPPHFIDKFLGIPSIANLAQLQDLMAHCSRIWIIRAATGSKLLDSPQVNEFLQHRAKVVFQSDLQEVWLLNGLPGQTVDGCLPVFTRSTARNEPD